MRYVVWILIATGLASGGPKKAPSLLANGSFEKKLEGWVAMSESGQTKYETDKKTRKDGKYALKVTKTGKFSHGCSLFTNFNLPEGQRTGKLKISARIKAKKLGNAWLRYYLYDAAGENIKGDDLHTGALNGSFNWKTLKYELEIPEGAVKGRILLNIYMGETIWLDDLRVEHKGPKGKKKTKKKKARVLALANGDFERSTRGWSKLVSPADTLSFKVDKKALQLARDHPRLLPQEGVYADTDVGRKKRVKLKCKARVAPGARAVATLLAFNKYGAFVASKRAELREAAEGFTALEAEVELPRGTVRLRVALAIEGSGSVWFDDITLGGK